MDVQQQQQGGYGGGCGGAAGGCGGGCAAGGCVAGGCIGGGYAGGGYDLLSDGYTRVTLLGRTDYLLPILAFFRVQLYASSSCPKEGKKVASICVPEKLHG